MLWLNNALHPNFSREIIIINQNSNHFQVAAGKTIKKTFSFFWLLFMRLGKHRKVFENSKCLIQFFFSLLTFHISILKWKNWKNVTGYIVLSIFDILIAFHVCCFMWKHSILFIHGTLGSVRHFSVDLLLFTNIINNFCC